LAFNVGLPPQDRLIGNIDEATARHAEQDAAVANPGSSTAGPANYAPGKISGSGHPLEGTGAHTI